MDAVVKNVRYKARPVLHVLRGSAGDLPSLQEGLKIAASATASVRVSVGPKFVAVDSAASAGGRAGEVVSLWCLRSGRLRGFH